MSTQNDDMLPEYDLDSLESKPNRFAKKYNQMQRTVVLDSDVAENFRTLNRSMKHCVLWFERKRKKPNCKRNNWRCIRSIVAD
jgi:hypothetical protein